MAPDKILVRKTTTTSANSRRSSTPRFSLDLPNAKRQPNTELTPPQNHANAKKSKDTSPSQPVFQQLVDAVNSISGQHANNPLLPIVTSLITITQQLFEQQTSFTLQQQEFHQQQIKLKGVITKLDEKLDGINARHTTTTTSHQAPCPPTPPAQSSSETRRSVVVAGLPELTTGKPSEKAAHDMDKVTELLDAAGIDTKPVSCYRLGRIANKPRMVKVVFPNSNSAYAFHRNRGTISKIPNLKHILIRPSMDAETLAKRWKLMAERNELNNGLLDAERTVNPYILWGPPGEWKLIRRSDIGNGRGEPKN